MQQMGDMLSQANEQLADLTDSSSERSQILAGGIAGQGMIVAHGTPERGAQWFNLDIDLEIHVSGQPARGEVRPAAGAEFTPAPAPPPQPGGGDHIAELERLAKLRDSGALTDAEFEQQKAKILDRH